MGVSVFWHVHGYVCVPVPKGWCNFITYGVVLFHLVLPVIGPPHLFFLLNPDDGSWPEI